MERSVERSVDARHGQWMRGMATDTSAKDTGKSCTMQRCASAVHVQRGPEAGTGSPHAATMMARVRKWTARCHAVGILSASVVLVLVVLVFWFSVSLLATLGSGLLL